MHYSDRSKPNELEWNWPVILTERISAVILNLAPVLIAVKSIANKFSWQSAGQPVDNLQQVWKRTDLKTQLKVNTY